jgi:hypothetical protein
LTSARSAFAAGSGVPKKIIRVIAFDPNPPDFDRGHQNRIALSVDALHSSGLVHGSGSFPNL